MLTLSNHIEFSTSVLGKKFAYGDRGSLSASVKIGLETVLRVRLYWNKGSGLGLTRFSALADIFVQILHLPDLREPGVRHHAVVLLLPRDLAGHEALVTEDHPHYSGRRVISAL